MPVRVLCALIACLLMVACAAPAGTTGPAATGSERETVSASPSASPTPSAPPSVEPSSSASASPETATWTALDVTGPSGREDHTWTVDPGGDVAYLFGGRDRGDVSDELWAYTLETDTWTQLDAAPGPGARFGHEAVWAPGTGLVIFAGQADADTFFNDLWAYDPEAAAWTQLPSSGDVPVARYGSCAAIGPDGRMWISHGFTSENARFDDTRAYDFASGAWTDETPEPPLPVERCLHGCWWTDTGELALFGGQTTAVSALGDLWMLGDEGWTEADGVGVAGRNLYARARIPGATLVFGGQAEDRGYLADTFILADGGADSAALEVGGPGPSPRAGAEVVADVARDRVLLFGGRDEERAFDDVWELRGIELGG